MLIEFSPETSWEEIKAVLSKHEINYDITFSDVAIWNRDGKRFLCFTCIKNILKEVQKNKKGV